MKKLSVFLAVFVCVFALVSVSITYMKIAKAKNEMLSSNDIENTPDDEVLSESIGIDLYGTYDQNDLYINEIVEYKGDVEVRIPEISGLKNKKIEKKVNDDIRKRTTELLDRFETIDDSYLYTFSNFANVISLQFFVADDNSSDAIFLNYELVNGERLHFEDLFIKDADIHSVVRSAFYMDMSRYNAFESRGVPVSPNEEDLYKIVKAYLSSKDPEFAFSPAEIYLYQNYTMASISMIDVADIVAIYSKYMGDKSIFSNDGIGYEGIFNGATIEYGAFDKIEYGYFEDNLWYDITSWDYQEGIVEISKEQAESFEDFKKNIYLEIDSELNKYAETAKNNKEKFYIVLIKPNIVIHSERKYAGDKTWISKCTDAVKMTSTVDLYEMPVELYYKVYKDKLIESYRSETFTIQGGIYLEEPSEYGVLHHTERKDVLYNYVTGKKIETVDDIFYENGNYMSVIHKKVKETLMNDEYCYSEEEATAALDLINCELDEMSILVTLPGNEDFRVKMFFYQFDKKDLKIFS